MANASVENTREGEPRGSGGEGEPEVFALLRDRTVSSGDRGCDEIG